jgi:hypothetical protein
VICNVFNKNTIYSTEERVLNVKIPLGLRNAAPCNEGVWGCEIIAPPFFTSALDGD